MWAVFENKQSNEIGGQNGEDGSMTWATKSIAPFGDFFSLTSDGWVEDKYKDDLTFYPP